MGDSFTVTYIVDWPSERVFRARPQPRARACEGARGSSHALCSQSS